MAKRTTGVGKADAIRAGADCHLVEPAQRRRIGARGVFGDVHHLQPLAHREPDRVLGGLEQPVEVPAFGVLPDWRRADEHADFERQPGALADLDDRDDVGLRGAGRAVGAHLQPGLDDLARQPFDIADDVRAGAGEANVGGIDAEPIDQVEDFDLLIDGRRPHRRRLQAVAQRLVVEHHARRLGRRADLVPVVD
jgi:hypothetical protein